MTRPHDDLKIACMLSGAFAIIASAAVPFLLDALPPDARSLPLPLPGFCVVLAFGTFLVYGLLAWAGIRMSRATGHEPAPVLGALARHEPALPRMGSLVIALGSGFLVGTFIVVAVALIRR